MVTYCIYDYGAKGFMCCLFLSWYASFFKTEPHWHFWQRPRLVRHTLGIQTLLSTFYSIILSYFPPNFCMYLSLFNIFKDPLGLSCWSSKHFTFKWRQRGVQSLVREMRPHMPGPKSQKQKQSCNMFNKDLKMVYMKKS